MNVVQVNFYLDPFGRSPEALLDAWPTLTRIAAATAQSGCRVTVVQAARQTATIQRDRVVYEFLHIPSGPFGYAPRGTRWIRGFGKIASVIADTRPDVVHIHGLIAPVQTRLLTRRLRTVRILAQDHASRPVRGARHHLYRFGFSDLSAVAFTSREQSAPFVQAGVLSRDLPVFEVIEASSTFTPGPQTGAQEKSGLSGDPCVLWVGRLDANKDPLTVLDAVDRVIPELPEIRLWCLYSAAPLHAAVKQRLDVSSRLRDRVRLLGRVSHDQIQDYYRAADLFTLGSREEGSGYALLEALACGVTPVVTSIPSFRKITGEVGALFQPGDSGRLAEEIVRFSRRDRFHARAQVRDYFDRLLSYESIGRQWVDAYLSLVSRR